MKIAVINNWQPFTYGGAEFLADSLVQQLKEYGHDTILIKTPFKWDPPHNILNSILANRLLRINQSVYDLNIDRVIPLKFPAYCIEHPNKVLWLLHQYRQVYDLWDGPYGLPHTDENRELKRIITNIDKKYLTEARKIYTNNAVVSERLKKFNNINSEVLYPPLMNSSAYYCKSYGDYIFYPSRVVHGKRQHIAIESMKYTKTDVKLIVAGKADPESWGHELEKYIKENDLKNKVVFLNEFIEETKKNDYFANALGVVYIPYDEDSYGYVTLESYHSMKPVITSNDSGGTRDVVTDNMTGLIVNPDPEELADAFDKLYSDKNRTKLMGENGYEKILSMGISWDNVIKRLTS